MSLLYLRKTVLKLLKKYIMAVQIEAFTGTIGMQR